MMLRSRTPVQTLPDTFPALKRITPFGPAPARTRGYIKSWNAIVIFLSSSSFIHLFSAPFFFALRSLHPCLRSGAASKPLRATWPCTITASWSLAPMLRRASVQYTFFCATCLTDSTRQHKILLRNALVSS